MHDCVPLVRDQVLNIPGREQRFQQKELHPVPDLMDVLDGEHGGTGLWCLVLGVERVVVGEGGVRLEGVLHDVWCGAACGTAVELL